MVAISEARCPDYPRFVYSALLLIFSCTITFYAIIEQKTVPIRIIIGFIYIF